MEGWEPSQDQLKKIIFRMSNEHRTSSHKKTYVAKSPRTSFDPWGRGLQQIEGAEGVHLASF